MITWANSITASRIIFFALCIVELSYSRPYSAIAFFLLAWGLDAIDGPIARYMGQESAFGSQLDKTIDRIVLLGSVVFLTRYNYIPPFAIFLFTKDIGLAMALTAKKRGVIFPSAAWKGKLASVLQGCAILWLFFGFPFQQGIVAIVAVFGAFVAVDYLRRL
ncbi:MAG: CDP-alcohol phosphatidyltransferase family protein [bacterium]|nr:CDP-alcohol phosphatidyltransferase family protein [bacterium]